MNKKDLAQEFADKLFKRIGKVRNELYYVDYNDIAYIIDYIKGLESLVGDEDI